MQVGPLFSPGGPSFSRICSRNGDRHQLTLVSLGSFVDKTKIQSANVLIKGTKAFVSSDFSRDERSKRKILVTELKKLRREERICALLGEYKLIMDGEDIGVTNCR